MLRKLLFITVITAVMVSLLPLGGAVTAQGGPTGQAISNLNVRTGPGTEYTTLTTITRGASVIVEGRNQVGDWIMVHTTDGLIRGWVASRYVQWGDEVALADLRVITEIIPAFGDAMMGAPMVDVGDSLDEANAVTITAAPMRQGADTGYPTLGFVPNGAGVVMNARSENGEWVLAYLPDGQLYGWMIVTHLQPNIDINTLPVENAVLNETLIYEYFLARLENLAVLPTISERAYQIFQTGQERGLNRHAFSEVGDCHTDHEGFFYGFGLGEYDLGEYGYLQDTIDWFSQPIREGVDNSFVNTSMSALSAFNAWAVQDPVWADPAHCNAGETPLACEYRRTRPAVAVILFGSVDMQIYEITDFAYFIRQIVQDTIDEGIVPVLSTFPSNQNYLWEKSLQFNAIILDIAAEEQIPVINLWQALRPLPNNGLTPDNFHISFGGDRAIHFTGDENQWGMTMRNLVTLQALHQIHHNLLVY